MFLSEIVKRWEDGERGTEYEVAEKSASCDSIYRNITLTDDGIIYADYDNSLVYAGSKYTPIHWQPVHKPVPFMEAFNAWQNDGKTIRCCPNGEQSVSYTINQFNKPECHLNTSHIANGKWYVEVES